MENQFVNISTEQFSATDYFQNINCYVFCLFVVLTSFLFYYYYYYHHYYGYNMLLCTFCRRKQDEVAVLEDTIRMRSEQQKKAGVELEATCHICLKTKFADGIGHVCHYCNIRCCARCGGKVTLRSNKVCYYIFFIYEEKTQMSKKRQQQ